MKKILVLFLVLFLPLAAFAQEPLSQEVLDQAKLQAGLFLELKNALGLAWMDDYNAYLEDPANSPQPAWASSVQDLINDNYLSGTFPTDFVITPTGQEVTISRTITSQAIKDVLPIYLPSVAISGDTVSLLVQRPEQWVAWQAGLLGKVSRDGSDDPDILPNSVLDFGEGSEIRFVNNDGKISGVDSLIYKTQELDDRFVNTSGDDEMSGTLTAGGLKVGTYAVWHEGNVGDGSGLDADLLDGQHGSYYLAAENLTGIIPPERLKGQTYDINISGRASVATKADHATDSDTLDSHPASDFATAGHSHSEYLNKTKPEGDTMIGPLGVNFENGISSGIGSHSIRGTGPADVVGKGFKIDWDTDFGFFGLVDKGSDRKDVVFANEQTSDNFVFMSQGMEIMTLKPASKTLEIGGNKVWHAGNDGLGSELDADYIDGKNAEWGLMQQKEVLTVILSPFEQALDNGMCYDGQYLWCAGEGATAAVVSPNGALVRTVSSPGFIGSTGLAWDGQYVWSVCGNGDEKVYKINPDNGNVLLSFNAPVYEMYGLTYDGTYLWGISAVTNRVYCFSKNGSVIKSFPFPGLFCDGLAWDGTYLWGVIGDNNAEKYSNIICKFTTNGEFLEFYSMPGSDYNSITFDGNFLWVFNCMTRTIEKLFLKTLPVVTYLQ